MSESDPSYLAEVEMIKIRGEFIHHMCSIESVMNAVIALHFCKKERAEEFLFVVTSQERFTLSFKIGLISFIVKNHYEEIEKQNTSFFEDMEELMKYRNLLAHHKYSPSNEEAEEQLKSGLIVDIIKTARNVVVPRPVAITKESIASYYDKLESVLEILGDLYEKKMEERK